MVEWVRCALCRTVISATAPTRTVDGQTYHAGCWDRKVRQVIDGLSRGRSAPASAPPAEGGRSLISQRADDARTAARRIRAEAWRAAKHSQQLRDQADVLAREAEVIRDVARLARGRSASPFREPVDHQPRSLLRQYAPMVPMPVRGPFHRDGWVYEEKIDGWRLLAYKDGARVWLLTRNGINHVQRFPRLAAALAALRPARLVLDGEVAIFDDRLRSRADWLRRPPTQEAATPPTLIAFDLLYVNGRDLAPYPLAERRARLEEVVAGGSLIQAAQRLASNGLQAWAQVLERGYEGLIAKDEAGAYQGGTTRAWLKVKQSNSR